MFGLSKPVFTDASVHPLTIEGRPDIKAVCTVLVGGVIRLTSIKLVERGGVLVIRTPKKDVPNRDRKTYDYFFPVDAAAREDLTKVLVEAYNKLGASRG